MDGQTGEDRGHESPNFKAILEEQKGVFVVVGSGELDLGTVPELRRVLDQAIAQSAADRGVVVDLSRVRFMESVTLGMLVEQRNRLREADKKLALVIRTVEGAPENPEGEPEGKLEGESKNHPVGRLLELTGQAGEFSVYDSRASAVRDVSPS